MGLLWLLSYVNTSNIPQQFKRILQQNNLYQLAELSSIFVSKDANLDKLVWLMLS